MLSAINSMSKCAILGDNTTRDYSETCVIALHMESQIEKALYKRQPERRRASS